MTKKTTTTTFNIYSSSLINFGRTDKHCPIAGICVDAVKAFCVRKREFFRKAFDNGIINSFEVKLRALICGSKCSAINKL